MVGFTSAPKVEPFKYLSIAMVRRTEAELDNGYCTSDAETVTDDAILEKAYKNGTKTQAVDEVGDLADEEFLREAEKIDYEKKVYKWNIRWRNVIWMCIYHIGAAIGLYWWLYKIQRATFWWCKAIFCFPHKAS